MRKPSEHGFTIIELMVTVAILGVLAMLAVGYSGTFFAKSRLNQLARGVYTTVSAARAEAVRNSRHTVVTFGTNYCIAFYDKPAAGVAPNWQYDAGTDVMLYQFNYSDANLTSAGLTITPTNLTTGVFGVGTIPQSLIFNGSGYNVMRTTTNNVEQLTGSSIVFQNNAIPASNNVLRRIDVTVAGAVRVLTN